MKRFSLVAALTPSRGIGFEGDLPWPRLKKDFRYFKQLTSFSLDPDKQNAVIMGRKTWESIPDNFRPLPGRLNVVLSRNSSFRDSLEGTDAVITASSFSEAIQIVCSPGSELNVGQVFVIGGEHIYREALKPEHRNLWDRLYLTQVQTEFPADRHFPDWKELGFRPIQIGEVVMDGEKGDIPIQFCIYQYLDNVEPPAAGPELKEEQKEAAAPEEEKNLEEMQYLDLIREIIETGAKKDDRTGVGTLSVFGRQMRFNLRNGRFPLLTTKRVFWRGVVEELLWLIRGSTSSKELSAKKVKIWDGNGSRGFLDQRGHYYRAEGDLGPVYGFQWRHFGAAYIDCVSDYSGQGVDQLKQIIQTIKTNPNDRRIIMSAWNPADLPEMALPPCHLLCQFYVSPDGELSCQMYQRSCDMGLGVPFNIASYSLLTCILARVCGLKPGDFVHCLGDTHVYLNHVQPLKEQLQREPRPFPILKIREGVDAIEDFKFEDFELEGYHPYPTIKMEMAV